MIWLDILNQQSTQFRYFTINLAYLLILKRKKYFIIFLNFISKQLVTRKTNESTSSWGSFLFWQHFYKCIHKTFCSVKLFISIKYAIWIFFFVFGYTRSSVICNSNHSGIISLDNPNNGEFTNFQINGCDGLEFNEASTSDTTREIVLNISIPFYFGSIKRLVIQLNPLYNLQLFRPIAILH